ncbi:sulfur acquisition oxidoreductase, SfnB family [Thermomonospora echinospora]|uniref:Dibenzothiophene monooxygenase n=1 Tax=Thermomonospora echinospora TaxID=1992 RepID=A0A1H6B2L1_9ACTN|nr:acyl-CoA dehydrogenase family protein [Thermomonospora echinospora]SEG54457.1 sulfur acquisition oxidoreductase, SfnB family [Thermomonospora echinospora]
MAHLIRDDTEAVEVARELAARLAVGAARRDADRTPPVTELAELSESGLLGITVPREHGGAGVGAVTLGEVFRLLSAADPSIGQIPQNHFFFVRVLAENGTGEQRAFFYAELLKGRRFGNALAEAGAANAFEFRTRLTRRPDGDYTVSGTKSYATGSPFAHWIPVYATDEEGRVHAVFIPRDAPGLEVVDDWSGFGQRTTGSGTVHLNDVRVPADRVVPHYRTFERPEVFGAFGQYMHAAIDVGIAGGALAEGASFVRASARPWPEAGVDRLAREPLVIQKFGELALLVRAAEALLVRAGQALDAALGHPSPAGPERSSGDPEPAAGAGDPAAAPRSGPGGSGGFGSLTAEDPVAEASLAVAAARAQGDIAALTVSSEVLGVVGARASLERYNLDRHWRNARTHTLHDPRRWKLQHLGDHALNGVAPPPNGIV